MLSRRSEAIGHFNAVWSFPTRIMGINADELREARIRHLQRTAALLKAARREKRASIYEPDNATLKAALKHVERLLAEARHETAAARR